MLYFTLTISLVHLACMNLLAYPKCLGFARAPMAVVLLGGLFFIGMAFPVLFLQAIGVSVLFAVCQTFFHNRRWVFAVFSVLGVGMLFGAMGLHTLSLQNELRESYPMQSMAERVPSPKLGKPIDTVAEAKAWLKLEERIAYDLESEQQEQGYRSRTDSLRKLHEETTDTFVNSPGFGAARMRYPVLDSYTYKHKDEDEKPLSQPEESQALIFSTEDLHRPYADKQHDELRSMHFDALRDFVNFKGFGFIKDRQHVAGFRPHQFSTMPAAGRLHVKRLELVSLLMHDKPAVYVSTELPRMGDLKHTATRTLSEFEAKGLLAVQAGEDLFARETPEAIHLFGAIRNVSQCVKCHGGERGDLLGAFSYQLRRDAR